MFLPYSSTAQTHLLNKLALIPKEKAMFNPQILIVKTQLTTNFCEIPKKNVTTFQHLNIYII
jgi:hypothetical protein